MSEYYMIHTGAELDDAISKVKSGYIDKTKISRFATGVVNNVTSGGQIKVTGIKDSVTGETFNLKGIVAIACPTSTTNLVTSSSKPGVVAFFKMADNSEGIGIATYSSAYSARANTGMADNDILSVSGNSFTFAAYTTMWGAMACSRWRWFAWG